MTNVCTLLYVGDVCLLDMRVCAQLPFYRLATNMSGLSRLNRFTHLTHPVLYRCLSGINPFSITIQYTIHTRWWYVGLFVYYLHLL